MRNSPSPCALNLTMRAILDTSTSGNSAWVQPACMSCQPQYHSWMGQTYDLLWKASQRIFEHLKNSCVVSIIVEWYAMPAWVGPLQQGSVWWVWRGDICSIIQGKQSLLRHWALSAGFCQLVNKVSLRPVILQNARLVKKLNQVHNATTLAVTVLGNVGLRCQLHTHHKFQWHNRWSAGRNTRIDMSVHACTDRVHLKLQ